ncbi:hypothetical protein M622_06700 [Thauera terpenica 58Eu]|uniref:Uncharacterized protein n=1 Tax=Thauera terpenica 58Eu TaxID=1348657 RepID=S9ZI32_9RHOO|nr:hypothetical protein M622_06700 [Thauera terpenica 58Eu]
MGYMRGLVASELIRDVLRGEAIRGDMMPEPERLKETEP